MLIKAYYPNAWNGKSQLTCNTHRDFDNDTIIIHGMVSFN
jgi:hypothetical protein